MENSLQIHSQYTRLFGDANGAKKLSDMISNMESLSKISLFSFHYNIYSDICQHCCHTRGTMLYPLWQIIVKLKALKFMFLIMEKAANQITDLLLCPINI